MANRYRDSEISSLADRPVFFDANILLYIFWPTGLQSWEKDYSFIFGSLLKQKNEMVVDFIVISEVVNRAIRIEHVKYLQINNISKDTLPFKKYRDSQNGREALNDIYQIIKKKVLGTFSVQGKSFSKSDIENFLDPADTLDFSDKAIVAICKEKKCILLTNDKDFAGTDIDILSSNPLLFRKI